jgi:hypothetical protein
MVLSGAAAQGVACCDVVNRGAVYSDGKVFFNTLDDSTIALDAETGKMLWQTKLGDINTGETITMAPLVVKGKVLVGDSGGELGVRGWLTALDVNTGKIVWRAYATGPDKEVLIGPGFHPFYPSDRGTDLGVTTWPKDAWQTGGGTMWGWIAYDPDLNLITRADRGLRIASFDDPQLHTLIIGVQMVGSDAMNTPPAHALARRGIAQNVRGYMLYGDYRQQHPPSAIIDAVKNGNVDMAIVWGPMTGYFAAQGSTPLTIEPVQPWRDGVELPMAFYISMGVRRGDKALLERLNDSLERNHAVIQAILAAYQVPVLPDAFAAPESAQR